MLRSSRMSGPIREGRRGERGTGVERQRQGRRVVKEKVEQRHWWKISRETAVQYCDAASRFRSPLRRVEVS